MFEETPILPLGHDFYLCWAAGRVLLNGGNPYDPGSFNAMMHHAGYPVGFDVPWFACLPTSLPWFLPFALVPFPVALALWYAVLVGAAVLLIRASCRLVSSNFDALMPQAVMWSVLLSFPPILRAMLYGQSALPLAALFIVVLVLLRAGRGIFAGALFSVVLFRPQSFLAVAPFLAVSTVRNRDFKFAIGAAMGFLFQAAAITALRPTIWSEYFKFSEEIFPLLAAMPSGLSGLGVKIGWSSLPKYLPICAVLLGGVLPLVTRISTGAFLWFIVPLSLLAAPYGWVHESLILAPVVAAAAGTLYERYSLTGILPLLLLFVPLLFLIPGSLIEYVQPLLPISALLFGLLVLRSGEVAEALRPLSEPLLPVRRASSSAPL